MAFTARDAARIKRDVGVAATGGKAKAPPVLHGSLSWAKSEAPTQAEKEGAVRERGVAGGRAWHRQGISDLPCRAHRHRTQPRPFCRQPRSPADRPPGESARRPAETAIMGAGLRAAARGDISPRPRSQVRPAGPRPRDNADPRRLQRQCAGSGCAGETRSFRAQPGPEAARIGSSSGPNGRRGRRRSTATARPRRPTGSKPRQPRNGPR